MKIYVYVFILLLTSACKKVLDKQDVYTKLCGEWHPVDGSAHSKITLSKRQFYKIDLGSERGLKLYINSAREYLPKEFNGKTLQSLSITGREDLPDLTIWYESSFDTMICMLPSDIILNHENLKGYITYVKKSL